MSQYQYQYYNPAPAPGPQTPNPNSSFYAARQRFEHVPSQGVNGTNGVHTPTPPHLRPNANDYKKHSAPPKHPVLQNRFEGQAGTSTEPGYIQSHNQQGYTGVSSGLRPQNQYGNVPTYQPPHAQTQAQPTGQGQAPFQPAYRAPVSATAPSAPAAQYQDQSDFNAARYANTPYAYTSPSVPMPRMGMSGTSPAKAFAMYEAWNAKQQQRERQQEEQRTAAAQAQTLQVQQMQPPIQQTHFRPQTQQYASLPSHFQYSSQQYQPQQPQYPTLASLATNLQSQYRPPENTGPVASPLMPSLSEPPALSITRPLQSQPQLQVQPQLLQRQPTVSSRRPLPQPGQARPRPVSMPPQSQAQGQGSAFQPGRIGNAPASSLPSVSPAVSIPTGPVLAPTSSLARSASPVLHSHPSSSTSSSLPIPTAMRSPEKATSILSGENEASTVSRIADATTPRTLAQRRALPQSPTAPPDLSQLQHRRSVPSLGSTSVFQPMRTSTLPPISSSMEANETMQHGSHQRPTTVPIIADSEPITDDDRLSIAGSTRQDGKGTSLPASSPQTSPQYGILELPKRNFSRAMDPDTNVHETEAVENKNPGRIEKAGLASPQYGIKDLPVRTKSIVDRRKAWERAEKGMQESEALTRSRSAKPASAPFMSSSPTKPVSAFSTPVPSALPSSPFRRLTAPTQMQTPIAPSRSPQPQTPQQQQKLPMPVVRQPQPSRTERTPSWTLPSADLDKIAPKLNLGDSSDNSNRNNGEQKTSLALRFAQMALQEENDKKKQAQAITTTITPAIRGGSRASTSASSSGSPNKSTRSHSSRTHTPRKSINIDLNLDDPPPISLRRTPSPSASTSTASSIPMIKTPEDVPQSFQSHNATPMIPKISLPGGFDDDSVTQFHAPVINVVSSPQKSNVPSLPTINLPGDDDMDNSGPTISISVPSPKTESTSVSMPVILDDLANSATTQARSRGLPRPPSASTASSSSFTTTSTSTLVSGSDLRSRGGGLVCGGCKRGIVGRIVSAMGLRWHPDCFKCCQCGEHLEHVSSYEHDGKPYCHLDYHELYAPQCYSCKTPIIDERFITLDDPALGKRTYHEQHFFCAECGDPFLAPSSASLKPRTSTNSNSRPNEISIKGDGAFDVALDEDGMEVGFTVFRGHPYCEACHVRLRAPKCKKCKKSIRDGMRAVEALGGKWCFECFVCAGCEKPFEEPSFFQREKMPFCEHCFSIILRNEV